ncbi:MAG: MBOAT family protein [Ruminococcaceae bacterium]|nr:MBOAT family protein [Oscillospiraceae bacterium]
MLFSSFSFLLWFLPLTLLFYFLPPALARARVYKRKVSAPRVAYDSEPWLPYQNGVLLVASLLFYAWGEPLYVFLMIGVILTDTLLGVLLERARRKRLWLALAVFLHVALLFYYKYAAFFAHVSGFYLPSPPLPLGISFYTFQALSYLIDVYRGDARAERSPALLGVYVALFPQLVAGPIVRYTDVAAALRARTHSLTSIAAGGRRFAAGLAKKLLLANPMGALFADLMPREGLTALGAWLALFAFAFQIYFDFSGYSDMAIGLGRVFGFRFPENFRYPYTAVSITDFWRRWHITLSSFFREYVYIPLGGNRRGVFRTVLHLFAVWALTGLWHGAAWSFLLWGLYYFLLLTLEKFLLSRLPKPPLAVRRALTLLAVLFGWMLFAFDGSTAALSFPAMGRFLATLLGGNGFWNRADLYDAVRYLPQLLLCAIGSTPLPKAIYRQTVYKKRRFWVSAALPLAALLLSLADLSAGGFNPFLYFRF